MAKQGGFGNLEILVGRELETNTLRQASKDWWPEASLGIRSQQKAQSIIIFNTND